MNRKGQNGKHLHGAEKNEMRSRRHRLPTRPVAIAQKNTLQRPISNAIGKARRQSISKHSSRSVCRVLPTRTKRASNQWLTRTSNRSTSGRKPRVLLRQRKDRRQSRPFF